MKVKRAVDCYQIVHRASFSGDNSSFSSKFLKIDDLTLVEIENHPV